MASMQRQKADQRLKSPKSEVEVEVEVEFEFEIEIEIEIEIEVEVQVQRIQRGKITRGRRIGISA